MTHSLKCDIVAVGEAKTQLSEGWLWVGHGLNRPGIRFFRPLRPVKSLSIKLVGQSSNLPVAFCPLPSVKLNMWLKNPIFVPKEPDI
jgi:hypothetical protein